MECRLVEEIHQMWPKYAKPTVAASRILDHAIGSLILKALSFDISDRRTSHSMSLSYFSKRCRITPTSPWMIRQIFQKLKRISRWVGAFGIL